MDTSIIYNKSWACKDRKKDLVQWDKFKLYRDKDDS